MLSGPIHSAYGEAGYLLLVCAACTIFSHVSARRSVLLRYKAQCFAEIDRREKRLLARKERLVESVRKKRAELEAKHEFRLAQLQKLKRSTIEGISRLEDVMQKQVALYDEHINYPERVPNLSAYEEEMAHYEKLALMSRSERIPVIHWLMMLRSAKRLNDIRKRRST